MEREMCSYLAWQLDVKPNALEGFKAAVRGNFKGLGPLSSPFWSLRTPETEHEQQPNGKPSFGPSTPPSPPSVTPSIAADTSSRRSSADAHPIPTNGIAVSCCSHLPFDIPSPTDPMSPVALTNYGGSTVENVSSTGPNLMQISSGNILPSPLSVAFTRPPLSTARVTLGNNASPLSSLQHEYTGLPVFCLLAGPCSLVAG